MPVYVYLYIYRRVFMYIFLIYVKGIASRLFVTAAAEAAKYFNSIERRDILHYILKKKIKTKMLIPSKFMKV